MRLALAHGEHAHGEHAHAERAAQLDGDVAVGRDPDLVVFRLRGDQTLANAAELSYGILQAAHRRLHVVVDVRDVTTIDSSVVGILISGRRHLAERGLGLALHVEDGDRRLHRLLELDGVADQLEPAASRADAGAAA